MNKAVSSTKGKSSAKRGGKAQLAPIILPMIKGVALGVIYTVLCILIFALIIKVAMLSDASIPPVNQIIKITGIIISVFFAVKKAVKKVSVGVLTGAVYIITGFLLFSLIDGQFGLISVLLSDLALGTAAGAIAAFIFAKLADRANKQPASAK